MFCPKCGAQVSDQAKFCPKCGARIFSQPAHSSVPIVEENQSVKSSTATGSLGGYSYFQVATMLSMLATIIAMLINWVSVPLLGAEFSVWSMFLQTSKVPVSLGLYPIIYFCTWIISLGFILSSEGVMLAKRRQTDASTLGVVGLVVIIIMAIVWIIDASGNGYGFIVPTQAPYVTIFLALVSIVLLVLCSKESAAK